MQSMAAPSLGDTHQQAWGQIKRAGLNIAFRKGDFFFSSTAVIMFHSVKHVGVTLCVTPQAECLLGLCGVVFFFSYCSDLASLVCFVPHSGCWGMLFGKQYRAVLCRWLKVLWFHICRYCSLISQKSFNYFCWHVKAMNLQNVNISWAKKRHVSSFVSQHFQDNQMGFWRVFK